MYFDLIYKNYFSIVKVDNNIDSIVNNVCFIGKEGVVFLILKKIYFMYLVKEIFCYELNCVIGVEVKILGGNLYIFGVYMFVDNNIDV